MVVHFVWLYKFKVYMLYHCRKSVKDQELGAASKVLLKLIKQSQELLDKPHC